MKLTSWLPYVTSRILVPLASDRKPRRGRRYGSTRLAGELLETRALLAVVTWDGADDLDGDGTSWNDPLNWAGDALPGATDDVGISAGFAGIVHSGGSSTVKSITSSSPVTLSGGTLTVSTTIDISSAFSLGGGTLANATTTSGTTITVTGGSTLSNVVLNGDLDLTAYNGVGVYVSNGLTLNGTASVGRADGGGFGGMYFYGTQTIDGTGSIVFGGYSPNILLIETAATTVTLGPNMTVHGARGSVTTQYSDSRFVNQGTIAADSGGRIDIGSRDGGQYGNAGSLLNEGTLSASNNGFLYVHIDNWSSTNAITSASGGNVTLIQSGINSGSITANGGAVYLDGSWTSSGAVTASGGGLVSLYNGSNSGAITANGGTVNFGGTWSDSAPIALTDGTLNFYGSGNFTSTVSTDADSAVEFYGGITSVTVTGGARVGLSGGTLSDGTLTLDAGQALHVDSSGTLSNVVLNGDLDLTAYNGVTVNVRDGLTLNGTARLGRADGGGWGGMYLYGTQTIGGTGSIVFGGYWPNGLVIATPATTVTLGSNLTVRGAYGFLAPQYGDSSFVNQGTIASDAGGRIDIGRRLDGAFSSAGSLLNQGTLAASHNGFLYVHTDNWSSTGAIISTSGGNVTLIQTGSNSGPITANGGTVALDGSWTSSGAITASSGGLVSLGGNWTNTGSLTGSSGGLVSINGNRTNSGSISATSGGAVDINGSWTNSSPLSASSGGAINFNGTWSNTAVPTLAGGILNLRGSGTWAAAALQGDATSAVNVYGVFTTGGSNLDVLGGLVHLSGGTMVNGTMDIGTAARLEFSGGILDSFTITNNGAATWTSGNVILTNGTAFNNAGTFDDQTDGTFGSDDVVCPDFTNSGTFIKSGGNGVTVMKTDFLNSGLVEIQHGILNIGCGYIQTGGSTVVTTGGAITGPVEVQGGSIEGPITGNVINSGDVSIPPSTTPTTTSSYTQSGLGSLTEQIGGLIPGIEYGQIQVSGDVNLDGTLHVALIHGFRPRLNDEFLIIRKQSAGAILGEFSGLIQGSTVWAGVYGFEISYVGGDGNDVTLKVNHSPIVFWDGNTDGDGDGASWNDPLNWSSDVQPGSNDDVVIDSGFSVTHSAAATDTVRSIESHGPLTISGGTLAVTSESIFAGGLTLSGGTLSTSAHLQIGDLVWTSGTMQGVGSPTATVTGTVSALGNIDLRDIKFDVTQATLAPGSNHLASLRLEEATLLRAETWTVAGPFLWMGGKLDAGSGVGSLIANGGMTITGGTVHNFAVTNAGNAVWSAGNVTFIGNSSFTNAIGANFDDQTDGSFGGVHPACPIFYNEGVFTKSGGDGTTELEMELHNRGEVRVERGTLYLTCGYVPGDHGTIGGGGGTGGSGGTVAVADFQQSGSGILIEQIAGTAIGDYGQIIVTGSVNLAGTLGVELLNGFTPTVGNTFVIIDNRGTNVILGTFANLPEGFVIPVGIYGFVISYVGGTGNDVVLTATLLNTAPTAVAGGPYFVPEGGSVVLNASGSTDPDPADTLTYAWDFDGDGDYDDATGVSPTFSAAGLDGPSSKTVRLRITDNAGAVSNIASATVNVTNAAPTAPVDNNGVLNEVLENAPAGTLVGITAVSSDPGVHDTVTFSLTDDAGGRFSINSSTGVVTVSNGSLLDYETATCHSITVEASDGQGGKSTQTFTINLLNVTATISGTVFVDADGDGLFDGGTETAIDAVMIELYNNAGGLLDTDLTSLGGVYAFTVNDEYATYRLREIQPTGVNNGAAILGSAGGDVLSSNEMRLTLTGSNASDYDFTESGQAVRAGDTASIGFWQNKNGQALIKQGGAALVTWLNANFGNIFGNTFSNGSGGDNAIEVASFYKNEFFNQKLKGTPKVDAQFMATALATFFTSSRLSGGNVAASYGFNVTQTGLGTKVVNIGSSGAAFGVSNNTNMTIMSLLLATNNLTGARANGYSNVYDTNGDGVLDANEKALRVLANTIYSAINEGGHI